MHGDDVDGLDHKAMPQASRRRRGCIAALVVGIAIGGGGAAAFGAACSTPTATIRRASVQYQAPTKLRPPRGHVARALLHRVAWMTRRGDNAGRLTEPAPTG